MAIDFEAMRKRREEQERANNSADFLNQKDIGGVGDETVFRLTPVPDSNQGLPYFEERGYWINGDRLISPESFGDKCPIREEIEEAKASGDKDIYQLLKSKNFSEKSNFYYVGLELECEWQNAKISDWKAKDDSMKFLQCTIMLKDAIEDIFYKRQFQNDSEDGIAALKNGFPIILTKKPGKNFTEYTAEGHAQVLPLPDKYAESPEPANLVRAKVYSEEYLRQKIRNYLYGEPVTVEEGRFYDDVNEDDGDAPQPEPKKAAPKKEAKEQPRSEPDPGAKEQPEKSDSGNPILDDLGDIGDLPM